MKFMTKSKLLKTILIPTLGISPIVPITMGLLDNGAKDGEEGDIIDILHVITVSFHY